MNLKSKSNRQAVSKPLFNPLKIKDLITVYSRWEKVIKQRELIKKQKNSTISLLIHQIQSKPNLFKQANKEVFYVL